MNRESIQKFLDYNYVPLTKSQTVARLFTVFLLSGVCWFLQRSNLSATITLLIANIIVLSILIYIWFVGVNRKNSRFLWDSVTFFYIPILLNIIAYCILTWSTVSDMLLLILLILALVICYLVSALIVLWNIYRNRYAQENAHSNSIMPYFFALLGLLFAKITSKAFDNQPGMLIIGASLLIISYLVAIGWTSIIRLILNWNMHNS